MLDQLQGLHIEPTNMCTLKCPRCSRTEFIETFKPKDWDNNNAHVGGSIDEYSFDKSWYTPVAFPGEINKTSILFIINL